MYDWSDLAFGSKKPLRAMQASFIAAPRQLSRARLAQLIKEYLPNGLILGIAKEPYIDGFAGQPHFSTLPLADVQSLLLKLQAAAPGKFAVLTYFQRELPHIIEKITPRMFIGINGSWQYSFHLRPEFYTLHRLGILYKLVSPFATEAEAKNCAPPDAPEMPASGTEQTMLAIARQAAERSFDYSFQTGAVLAKKQNGKYTPLVAACNEVVPYPAYALHYGAARENHFSPPHDLNYYDAVHAEIMMLIKSQRQHVTLAGTSLFINLLPCPHCARMLCMTDIAEIVYAQDHSQGYAAALLEKSGKKVRRITTL